MYSSARPNPNVQSLSGISIPATNSHGKARRRKTEHSTLLRHAIVRRNIIVRECIAEPVEVSSVDDARIMICGRVCVVLRTIRAIRRGVRQQQCAAIEGRRHSRNDDVRLSVAARRKRSAITAEDVCSSRLGEKTARSEIEVAQGANLSSYVAVRCLRIDSKLLRCVV